jgi:hypothetical protein
MDCNKTPRVLTDSVSHRSKVAGLSRKRSRYKQIKLQHQSNRRARVLREEVPATERKAINGGGKDRFNRIEASQMFGIVAWKMNEFTFCFKRKS